MSETTTEEQEQVSGPAFFGKEVRAWRIRAGMSQRELGERANSGQQYVAKVEAGERLASRSFAKVCDEVFGTPGTFVRLREWASLHGYPAWFLPYVQLERQATGISNFSATFIMGMLQTADYARAVFRAAHPREAVDKLDARVERRMRRREVMEKDSPPLVWCVLYEACLRAEVGGRDIMSAQMAHLLTEAESPHVALQVLPFGAGAPPTPGGFTLLRFDEGPGIVYADTAMAGQTTDTPEEVQSATARYDRLRARCSVSAGVVGHDPQSDGGVHPMSSALDLSRAEWVKSSYSSGDEGECVEFAPGIATIAGVVPVRDSKNPAGPALVFSAAAWGSFTTAVQTGEFRTA